MLEGQWPIFCRHAVAQLHGRAQTISFPQAKTRAMHPTASSASRFVRKYFAERYTAGIVTAMRHVRHPLCHSRYFVP